MAKAAKKAKRKARREKIKKALKGAAKKNRSGLTSAALNVGKFVVDAVKDARKKK